MIKTNNDMDGELGHQNVMKIVLVKINTLFKIKDTLNQNSSSQSYQYSTEAKKKTFFFWKVFIFVTFIFVVMSHFLLAG